MTFTITAPMDVEILARLQFAITIMFHYIYPPLSIGLGLVMVVMEGLYLKTKNPLYLTSQNFGLGVFALTFAMGVATGIVMEFEFGTNWATYSRYVGDVFGSALAAEGVFAFFLESGFLALLLFGWDRVGPKLIFFPPLWYALAHILARYGLSLRILGCRHQPVIILLARGCRRGPISLDFGKWFLAHLL